MPQDGGPLPSVTVVVSYLNSARTIGKCLDSLLSQDYDDFSVHVVDAGSTDGSIDIVGSKRDSKLRFDVIKDCSEAEGQTYAISKSSSKVLMFTNSDIYVPRDWISRHVRWLLNGYDLVGGKVFWGGDKYALTWNMPRPNGPRFIQEQGIGLGFSNCSTTREMFVKAGGLRDMSSQHDTEFAFRVVGRGGKMILDPAIEVYHDHPFRSFHGSFSRSFGYARNHVLVMRAMYGRIVSGSGAPAMVSVSSLIREWIGLAGVNAYKEHARKAASLGIRTNLLEFEFLRLFSTKLGQMFGVVAGATKRSVTFMSLNDLHLRSQIVIEVDAPRNDAKERGLGVVVCAT